MKKFACLFSLFLCFGFYAGAQTATVEGKVNGADGITLKSATVSLLLAADSSLQKLAVSDAAGAYRFDAVKNGQYRVQVSYTGYRTTYSDVFIMNGQPFRLPELQLPIMAGTGATATVTAKKPFVEVKAGKTVLNVESSVMAAGNTVMELIEKAPGVTVDRDDNLNIRGRQGVIVLIDGKPQQLPAADLANMLRNMPGSQVEAIEVITQASAKYDAAGNAGMINIRTKKTKKKGLNGTVNLSGGQDYYPRYSAGGNINYRKNKLNLFGNYSYSNRRSAEELDLSREVVYNGEKTVFEQYAFNPNGRKSHNAKIGMDYQLSNRTAFGLTADGFLARGSDLNNYSRTRIGRSLSETDSSIEVNSNKITRTKNGALSFNFRHRFDSTGRELTVDADRTWFSRDGDEFLDNFYYLQADKSRPQKSPLFLRNHAISDIDITVAKADYTHPLKNNAKIEAGVKYSHVHGNNDLRFDSLSAGQWVKDQSKTNHFIYDETVSAAYVNYSGQFKKWELMAGLRAEQTVSKGNSVTLANVVKRNYLQLFPSVFATYNHSENNQFSLAYSRRIQRPNYEKLNPFLFFLDQYTYQQGNPYLKPSVSDNVELSHTWKQFLTTSLSWQRIKDPSITVTEQDDATKITYAIDRNLNTQNMYGLGLNAGFPVNKWWNTQNNLQAFYLGFSYKDEKNNLETGRLAAQFNTSNSFSLGRGWMGELNGQYQSPLQFGIFKVKSQWSVGAGLKKDVLKKRGSLKFSIEDIFNGTRDRVSTNYQNMNIWLNHNNYNTIARVTFSMKFGKTDNQNRRRSGAASEERSRLNVGGSK